jgi:hypothetical protein
MSLGSVSSYSSFNEVDNMDNENYEAPKVVIEGELEVDAGTPIGSDLLFDWLDEDL